MNDDLAERGMNDALKSILELCHMVHVVPQWVWCVYTLHNWPKLFNSEHVQLLDMINHKSTLSWKEQHAMIPQIIQVILQVN